MNAPTKTIRSIPAGASARAEDSVYHCSDDYRLDVAVGCEGLELLQGTIHGANVAAGWWSDLETGERIDRNVPEMLCLIHSEISEAMEGHRKGLQDDKLPHRPMIEVELADALIRILDLAGGLQLDLAGAVEEKLYFNAQRADHKPENRRAANGKKY